MILNVLLHKPDTLKAEWNAPHVSHLSQVKSTNHILATQLLPPFP